MAEAYQTVTCVSAILVNSQGQILFQQRDNRTTNFPNYWALPGGHVEPGEEPHAAIVRELDEELEFTGDLTRWKQYDFWRTPDVLVHQYIYLGQLDAPLEQIRFHEGRAIGFFGEHDLLRYPIAFGFDQLCKEYFEHKR